MNNVDFIECGKYHVLCKTNNDEIFGWGKNYSGGLGVGDSKKFHFILLPTKFTKWPNNIVDIKCGTFHTLVLTSDQKVYSCGANNDGQIGRSRKQHSIKKISSLSKISRIECGDDFSMCLDIDGNLFVFGGNICGQLGLGDKTAKNKPIKHPSFYNVVDISSRGQHTFIKTSPKQIYAFGRNETAQLGVETENTRILEPIRVFEGNETIWHSNVYRPSVKSSRLLVLSA